ncbi:MAG: polysaccharide biosynthesis protein [Acidimicrobiia bacterium]|nr:polysaccharide biosynthesis protein [Acidimicrobiia bacterium]MBT8214985.1 polysaccharide biosynthesis protein [Acidimicrobiia bacterium]NNK91603.1 polysaccharide biosynthesis protein [Acidimicrobiia bacterium]
MLKRKIDAPLRIPVFLVAAADAVFWVTVLTIAVFARHAFVWDRVNIASLLVLGLVAAVTHLSVGYASGMYLGRFRFASFEETGAFVGVVAVTTGVLVVVNLAAAQPNLVPSSAVFAAAAYQVVLGLGLRYTLRLLRQVRRLSHHPREHRGLIFGAGDAGSQVARVLMEAPGSDVQPVAVLDDDITKDRLEVQGLRVVGTRASIAEAARRFRADMLIVAIPSASPSDVNEVAEIAQKAGLLVRILPPVADVLTEGNVRVGDIRDFALADFLGRPEVETDVESIAGYLKGKRVLVTGAGGSIGSVLTRMIAKYEPSELMMLDRDETALHSLQLELEGRALLDSPNLVLADIRDLDALRRVFSERRPDVVFHAAALKHLTMLERFPVEAVKTNVFGTRNVLQAALEAGVDRVVNVSTDKAADPTSMLGASKRLAEMVTASYAARNAKVFMSVRFGNVLGSRGSVIPTLRKQIEEGGPLTITHPEVTRYFMTIEEAAQLVIQAGSIGRDGEVLVLDMGTPVRIVDLARQLALEMRPGVEIPMEFTGLRPGEKLHEVLSAPAEEPLRRPHPLITSYPVEPMGSDEIAVLSGISDPDLMRELTWKLVTGAAFEAPVPATVEI